MILFCTNFLYTSFCSCSVSAEFPFFLFALTVFGGVYYLGVHLEAFNNRPPSRDNCYAETLKPFYDNKLAAAILCCVFGSFPAKADNYCVPFPLPGVHLSDASVCLCFFVRRLHLWVPVCHVSVPFDKGKESCTHAPKCTDTQTHILPENAAGG